MSRGRGQVCSEGWVCPGGMYVWECMSRGWVPTSSPRRDLGSRKTTPERTYDQGYPPPGREIGLGITTPRRDMGPGIPPGQTDL